MRDASTLGPERSVCRGYPCRKSTTGWNTKWPYGSYQAPTHRFVHTAAAVVDATLASPVWRMPRELLPVVALSATVIADRRMTLTCARSRHACLVAPRKGFSGRAQSRSHVEPSTDKPPAVAGDLVSSRSRRHPRPIACGVTLSPTRRPCMQGCVAVNPRRSRRSLGRVFCIGMDTCAWRDEMRQDCRR